MVGGSEVGSGSAAAGTGPAGGAGVVGRTTADESGVPTLAGSAGMATAGRARAGAEGANDSLIINGGDGAHEHPTQALLDAYIIRQRKGRLNDLKIAVIGDIAHSRVARSNVHLLTKFGTQVWLCSAPTLMPPGIEKIVCDHGEFLHVTHAMDEAVAQADVIMMLRVQFERMNESFFPSIREYFRYYGLTRERAEHAKSDVIIMHPGPINRGVEIATDVADGPYSVILDQVSAGVAVRMAVLFLLLGG